MRPNWISLSASPDAVDAAIYTKDLAVIDFVEASGVPQSQIGAIGDGANDIPFLRIPGLALAAAPNNAQEGVTQLLSGLPNGILLKGERTKGFLEFHKLAKSRSLSHIFADRDGVFEWETDNALMEDVFRVFETMGLEQNPFVFVLTGSSYEQNISFIEKLRINEAARHNSAVERQPFVVLAENGAVQINVLTLESRNLEQIIDTDLLDCLKGAFEQEVIVRLKDTILPRFGLNITDKHNDQFEKVLIPPKRTMLTINVPKWFHDGSDYRRSHVAREFREAVLTIMQEVAVAQELPYRLLC